MSPFLGALERLVLIRDGVYSPDARLRVRSAMILGLDRGMTAKEVARRAGRHRTTVYYWLRLYKKYRDPRALTGEDPHGGASARRVGQGGRAPAVNALRRSPTRSRPVSPLGPWVRRRLMRAARTAADPARRLDAAIAWARVRGVEPCRIAKAAGITPQAAYRAWRRAIHSQEG